jgi:hypothetical protein
MLMPPIGTTVTLTPSRVLLLRFAGTYPDGRSGGRVDVRDGHPTDPRTSPRGLVVDLRELRYEWGDMIEILYGVGGRAEPPVPQATVVSDGNRRALSTLARA